MAPFFIFNQADSTSDEPPQEGGQAQLEPNSAKAPTVRAERKENQAQGKWQEAQCAGNQHENELCRKLMQLSLWFQKTSG